MIVSQLIEMLQHMNPNATVVTSSNDFDLEMSDVEVTKVLQFKSAMKSIKTIEIEIDDDDLNPNQKRHKEIWNTTGGQENIVVIR